MANDPMPDIDELLPIVFEKGETEQQIWNATATAAFADREGGGLETLGTALETLRSDLHRLSGVVRVTGAAFAQLQSWPTGTSQSLHPADALAADEATIVQLLRDTADPLPIAPGEWQGPRVGLLG